MSKNNRIVLIIMLAIGAAIMGYSLRNVNMKLLFHDILTINVWWLLVALLCIVAYLVIEGIIVKVFVGNRVQGFTFKDALRVPLVEQLGNGITPFASGGQPFQIMAMMQAGVEPGYAAAILLMKFVVYQFVIVLNFFVALIIGSHFLADKVHVLKYLMIFGFLIHFAVIVGLILIMFWYQFTKRLTNIALKIVKVVGFGGKEKRLERYQRISKWADVRLHNFHVESVRMTSNISLMVKGLILTSFQLMFYYSIPYFILLALGYTHINYVLITSLHVLIVMVISIFPIPGGSGGAEVSFQSLFSSFINVPTDLVLAMFIWRFLTYYFGMFAGMVAFNIRADRISNPQDWHNQKEE
ncbi:lysylphosphatidylglycerol synthase transmembrane domain-containing protein [Periweissella fabalis]|uniref:Phosphatidylglycerol lysyltransferase n=1 Tax=Periweissella fabalis TaxID=1070421 RepID=A0A7X6N5A3_9LACO|nr:lysylphosphatidylglycerol synthase transmembrane domain-containing protein [Periweissella fabalis]MCM0598196.1 flippase-like domain-containing protein [Periweissella fabalis]NKZ24869.1 flippase-like domain-containing protein [Periweissella fabalis]